MEVDFEIKNQNLKYKILDKSMSIGGHTYYQIQAIKDFGNVKAGDLGGWVEDKKCLSQEGNCWVCPQSFIEKNGRVYDNAQIIRSSVENFGMVSGDAVVEDSYVRRHGKVRDKAKLSHSLVTDEGAVLGNAIVNNVSIVSDHAVVCDNASLEETIVKDYAVVENNASVLYSALYNRARVSDNARVFNSSLYDKTRVYENAKVYEKTELHDKSEIFGNTNVFSVVLKGTSRIYGDAKVVSEHLDIPALILRDNAEICGNTNISRIFVVQLKKPFELKGDMVLNNVSAEGKAALQTALDKEEERLLKKKYEETKIKDAERKKRLKLRKKVNQEVLVER